ncbi:MAG: HD domain-containing protein, partial [Pseudomonadales bacterium]
MVKVQDSIVRSAGGEIDIQSWQKQICTSYPDLDAACIERSLLYVRTLPAHREQFLEKGMELANLVASLNLDTASVAGALVYRPVRTGQAALTEIAGVVGQESADLVGAVVRMADTSLLEMTNTAMQTSEARDQVENVRLMLVSMIDDARVAVLKLAERVLALRSAKNSSEERRRRIAQEVHLVFVPLANRLGIWRLKWELEDLALRYLAPDIYKTIAGQLDGRREERESQIVAIAESVEQRLQDNGIQVKVSGRAKHIFSIWRKMSAKSIGLTEIYDVRAIRIVVADIASCYAALGIIHTEWQHIPSEFDDYIAVPKENGYRSIHTAVMGEDGKTLEVQIRTPGMHEEAELGVCAHWAYKDTGINTGTEDRPYAEKMDWLRQVVDWQEETRQLMNADLFREQHRHLRQERIFVYTPQGHVLDLTNDATPVDFAYRVHTEIGHRCIGVRVDGARVALNTPLQTGQRVEILTGDHEEPQRTWLDSHLEFVKTG